MRTKNIITGIMLFSVFSAAAQKKQKPQTFPVKYHDLGTYKNFIVGEEVPDFKIPKIIHSPVKSAKLSDFKDQLLIVDFWSTACSGCVEALPKMEALQKQFGDKVKILPVTYEPEDLIKDFWKTNNYIKNNSLPSVVEDTAFESRFQHAGVPHEIWIYKGKVIGITDAEYVDAYNIKEVLEGRIPDWPVKNDFYGINAMQQPLFNVQGENNSTISSSKYAAIGAYKEKDGANAAALYGNYAVVRDSAKKTVRSFFLNMSIYSIYFLSNSNMVKPGSLVKPASYGIGKNEVLWEVKDQSKYTHKPGYGYRGDWLRKNAICFEALYPEYGQTAKDISTAVTTDLSQLLGLNVRWEKRKEKVLVLVRTSTNDKLKAKTNTQSGSAGTNQHKAVFQLRNSALSNLAYTLNQYEDNPYVFDETNYEGNVDMELHVPLTDIAALRKALNAYDLDLREEERLVDKFVFTETR